MAFPHYDHMLIGIHNRELVAPVAGLRDRFHISEMREHDFTERVCIADAHICVEASRRPSNGR